MEMAWLCPGQIRLPVTSLPFLGAFCPFFPMLLFDVIVSEPAEAPAQLGEAFSLVLTMADYFLGMIVCLLAVCAFVKAIRRRSSFKKLDVVPDGAASQPDTSSSEEAPDAGSSR